MIYLSGAVRGPVAIEPHFGFLLTPRIGNRLPEGATWAADTGCFRHPDAFNLDKYLRWLDRKGPREACLFVNAPDVPYDMPETLRRAESALRTLRSEGHRATLVAQDGLTVESTPWQDIDGIFIGGSIPWKESAFAAQLVQAARARGVWAHYGRVNTPERIILAARAGADSVDGTRLAFGFDANWPQLREWVRCINAQQSFSFLAESTQRSALS
jgi:hypothetical protein